MKDHVIKNYIQYLLKSNRRLTFLTWLVCFLCIPFLAFVLLSGHPANTDDAQRSIFLATILIGILLSFLYAIYGMRFLYKKKSCNMYYSIPIKRNHLFLGTLLYDLLSFLVPILMNYVLALFILDPGALSRWDYIVVGVPIMILLLTIIHGMLTMICVKSNTLLDAIFLSACWLIVPYIVIGLVYQFVYSSASFDMVGMGNYADMIPGFAYLYPLFSPIYTLINMLVNKGITELSPHLWELYYWLVIGSLCYYQAYRHFVNRKVEESENYTTTLLGYPLIIIVTIFSILLNIVTGSSIYRILFIGMIFILYLVLVFMYKRTTKLKIRIIVIYLSMLAISFGFMKIFTITEGFGYVSELPKEVQQIKDVQLEIEPFSQDVSKYTELWKKVTDPKEIISYHNTIVKEAKKLNETNDNLEANVSFHYFMKDGRTIFLTYSINKETFAALIKEIEAKHK